MLNMAELIQKKKQGGAFTREEIDAWIRGAADGSIPKYQLSALLMAIYFQGMTPEETMALTLSMAHSGEMADLSAIGGLCVDKHSTGGVGDTTTLILTPLTAACGAKVAKMSGRGLGHTGGTVDKLESIPGMQTGLSMDAFIAQVQSVGCAIIGQTQSLAPADKALYALRDVTATVDSLPLIVSSIMSKKIAAGCGAIVLDVKTGSGAIMRTLDESIELARQMVTVGALAGRPTLALITGMDQPLGTHIGNALEVKEAIDILSGRAGGRLLSVSLSLGAMMLAAGGYATDEAEAHALLKQALEDGRGLAKLKEMIEAQGGDARVADDTALLPTVNRRIPVTAAKGGYITRMDTAQIGGASQRLGAGRTMEDDKIDPAVGIVMEKELGDLVEAGEPLATLHVNGPANASEAMEMVRSAIAIEPEKQSPPPLVYAVVRPGGVERFA